MLEIFEVILKITNKKPKKFLFPCAIQIPIQNKKTLLIKNKIISTLVISHLSI